MFKKLINLFFGDEEKERPLPDEQLSTVELSQGQRDEEIEESRKHQAPSTFRFPIISDAEIYGWEDEDLSPSTKNENPIRDRLQEEDDEYEPLPLYQNKRWPGKDQTVHIHRSAGTSATYRPSARQPITNKLNEQSIAQAPQKKSVTNKPFSPTQVPSPIFGLHQPTKKYHYNWKKIQKIDDPTVRINQKEIQAVPDKTSTPEHTAVSVQHEKSFEESSDFAAHGHEQETLHDPAQPMEPCEQTLKQLQTKTGHESQQNYCQTTESIDQEMEQNQEQQLQQQLSTDDRQQKLTVPDDVSEDNQQFYETNSAREHTFQDDCVSEHDSTQLKEEENCSKERIESINSVHPSNNDDLQEQDDTKQASPTPDRSEKTLPFNVMMLKSDREKWLLQQAREQQNITNNSEESTTTTSIEFKNEEMDAETELPHYVFPALSTLIPPEEHVEDVEWLKSQSAKLEQSLRSFSVEAKVLQAVQGPTVTRFEMTVGEGTKVSKIRNLTDDLKLALAAQDIRIQAPIPGTSSIGIEIPNRKPRAVRLSEVIHTDKFQQSESPLEAVLGLSLTGEPVTIDLKKMPHGMIAGATGSGKSVCINSILISLLFKALPTDLKLLLIDPKMVELAPYNGIPHLLSPVITDVKAATAALKWAVEEMERRYELFAHAGVRNIERYNEMIKETKQYSLKMPYLLIVIDELADLMMMAPADVEVAIGRITQKARACGIHLILATQRPSVDVITGTIKANVPTRIAFAVSSQVDSRTILDTQGAERLLGRGDMLYLGNGKSTPIRLQGTFVTDEEIERIIDHVKQEGSPNYLFGQEDLLASTIEEEETDPLFEEVGLFMIAQGSVSTSLLQRQFSIGYNRAAKLIDRMEKLGFISEQRGSKPRDVFVSESEFRQFVSRHEPPHL